MKYLIMISLILCCMNVYANSATKIDSMLVYKDFYRGGTTGLLKSVFNDPQAFGLNISQQKVEKKDQDIFSNILQNARSHKHLGAKINVELSFLMYVGETIHQMVITKQGDIIDFTSNCTYIVKDKVHKMELQDFVVKYKDSE